MLKKLFVFALCTSLAAPVLAGGYGGRYHYGGHYSGHYGHGHHGGGGDGAALLAGLVIGGLVGYFISEDRHYRGSAYRHDYGHGHGYGEPGHRHQWHRPVVQRQVVRVVPQLRYTATAPVNRQSVGQSVGQSVSEFAGEGCRMTREYTTTIEINGHDRDAYGTKCLTADGSWILGRPRLVPDFDQPNTN